MDLKIKLILSDLETFSEEGVKVFPFKPTCTVNVAARVDAIR